MSKKKYYLVSAERLNELVSRDLRLEALERGGVDNWSWYGTGDVDFIKEILGEDYVVDAWFEDAAAYLIPQEYKAVEMDN